MCEKNHTYILSISSQIPYSAGNIAKFLIQLEIWQVDLTYHTPLLCATGHRYPIPILKFDTLTMVLNIAICVCAFGTAFGCGIAGIQVSRCLNV